MALPILFLDFDGPLFPTRANLLPENEINSPKPEGLPKEIDTMAGYWKMDPIAVAMINKIVGITNAEIVISSSWKWIVDKEGIEKLFELNGMNVTIHDDWFTPNVSFQSRRAEEIEAWIEDHPDVEKWIAVDDDKAIARFPEKHKALVSNIDGISYKDYKHILASLS